MLDKTQNLKLLQPIDRVALGLMLMLSLLIGLLVWSGDHSVPYVRNFSWQEKLVGASDTFFVLTFSRPMDHASVEANLHFNPPLPGRVSWAGRRLVYTLSTPARYDTTYQVELQQAQQSADTGKRGKVMKSFSGQFRTRDRAFVYLGVEGQEKGRLILYNLTHNQKTILTPKDQIVTDFKPYPDGDRILFSATDWLNYGPGLFEQQLYSVTTGMASTSISKPDQIPAGIINLVLDNKDYQNFKFDLSADGKVIVVERVNRSNLKDSGLWVMRHDSVLQPLKNPPAGEFLLAPDSASLALSLIDGVSIVPLKPSALPLDFLPEFGHVLSFARDGIRAAMVKFNSDSTQSLFLVTNQGLQKELLRTNGERLYCQFHPSEPILYCLVTSMLPEEKSKETLFVAAIDLKKFKVKPLLQLQDGGNIQMSLSPDGSALLLAQVVTLRTLPNKQDLTTDSGEAIATSRLMLLPLVNTTEAAIATQLQPQPLPLAGFHPRWLP